MRKPSPIRVTIYGRDYHLVGPEPERTRELARQVDETMRRFSHRMHGVGGYQLAILAALHLADELATARVEYDTYQHRVDSSATRMLSAVGSALEGSGGFPPEPSAASDRPAELEGGTRSTSEDAST